MKYAKVEQEVGSTEFIGYEKNECDDAKILATIEGEGYVDVVLNKTPFYAECGGQVGDSGIIENENLKLEVLTTFKVNDLYVHRCTVLNGEITVGETVKAVIDVPKREEIRVHHTSAHLLQAALIKVVGDEVKQAGSYVDDERMRFDFTFSRAMTPDEIKKTENLMNKWIGEGYTVNTKVMGIEEAKLTGATALFGEKYGDNVRVVSIEKNGESISKEFCAGTHARELKDLRFIKIVSESAIAAGTRRIECVVSKSALNFVNGKVAVTDELASKFKAHSDEVIERVEKLQEENKELQKEIEKLQEENARAKFSTFLDKAQNIEGGKLFISKVLDLKPLAMKIGLEFMSKKLGESIIVLASDKTVAVKVSDSFVKKGVNAGKIVGEIARATGANGGGSPNFAQRGIKDYSKLDEILPQIEVELKK
jgi:alanyl-tRNA synthetase